MSQRRRWRGEKDKKKKDEFESLAIKRGPLGRRFCFFFSSFVRRRPFFLLLLLQNRNLDLLFNSPKTRSPLFSASKLKTLGVRPLQGRAGCQAQGRVRRALEGERGLRREREREKKPFSSTFYCFRRSSSVDTPKPRFPFYFCLFSRLLRALTPKNGEESRRRIGRKRDEKMEGEAKYLFSFALPLSSPLLLLSPRVLKLLLSLFLSPFLFLSPSLFTRAH